MVIAVYLFLLLYLLCCRPTFCNGIKDGSYLSRERTCTINAFMIVSVFFSHSLGFMANDGADLITKLEGVDHIFSIIVCRMGQMMVSTFLLFSGFGIMESVRKKGDVYLSGFLRHRFWKVLYQFELGILCYYVFALCWGERYTLPETLVGLTGWTKLGGNPTWFIFVTLTMYLIAFIGLHFSRWKRWVVIGGLSLLLYILLSHFRATERWWYDTLFCFPAGMLLSCYRTKLECAVTKMRIPAFVVGIVLVAVAYIPPGSGYFGHPLVYNVRAIMFAYGMALAWSGIRFTCSPRLMLWLGGSAVFCFYFYHVLVFKFVARYTPIELSGVQFLTISLPLSLVLAWLVMQLYTCLDKKVFRI